MKTVTVIPDDNKNKMEKSINVRKLLVHVVQTILHLADVFRDFRCPPVEKFYFIRVGKGF